ncbi:Deoxyribose-phosphate aldolase [Lemmus lemmus]
MELLTLRSVTLSLLDLSWITRVQVNQAAVLRRAEQIQARRSVKEEWQAAWLLKAVTFIDLTTLSGDDTFSNVQRLCYKARYPIQEDLLKALNMHDKGITTAAVCVYPARVCDAVKALKAAGCNIPVASVATGFPAGQTHLKTRLEEIRLAVEDGATEIDVVISRTLVLTGKWEALYDEISQFRKACGEAHLKTILATGELDSLTNIYKASLVAMMAGSDFIKTSTGKETVNATFPVAIVMLRAIRDFFWKTGKKVPTQRQWSDSQRGFPFANRTFHPFVYSAPCVSYQCDLSEKSSEPLGCKPCGLQLVCIDLSTPLDSYIPRLVNPGDQEVLLMEPVLS